MRQVYIDFPEEIKDQDAAHDSSKHREHDIFVGIHMFLIEFDRFTDMTYLFGKREAYFDFCSHQHSDFKLFPSSSITLEDAKITCEFERRVAKKSSSLKSTDKNSTFQKVLSTSFYGGFGAELIAELPSGRLYGVRIKDAEVDASYEHEPLKLIIPSVICSKRCWFIASKFQELATYKSFFCKGFTQCIPRVHAMLKNHRQLQQS